MKDEEKLLAELINDETEVLMIFNLSQELVQTCENKDEAQALNIMTGSSFALLHAIKRYKEVKDGKGFSDRARTAYS